MGAKPEETGKQPPESAVGKWVVICVFSSLIAVMNALTRIRNLVEVIEGKPRKVMVH